jgi:hypothetical protein
MQPLDSTPSLQPHYRPSSLLRVDPPQCRASVRSPRGFCHLCFSLDIAATGSRSSTQKPESGSRPLYAGRRLPSSQVPDKLIPRAGRPLGFDDESLVDDASSKGSLSFDSLIPTCPEYPQALPQRSPPCLLNTAAWGGLKPAPESRLRGTYPHLPCSFATACRFMLTPLAVCLRHTVQYPVQLVVSRPGESHPQPLAERCVNLSIHTAPIKQTHRPSLVASVRRRLVHLPLVDSKWFCCTHPSPPVASWTPNATA